MSPPDAGPVDGADPLWRGGWYRFAHALPSPNFNERPAGAVIDLIVIHAISLPPGSYGGDAVQRFFTNRLEWSAHPWFEQIRGVQVSAHFYIERSGSLWQFVNCDDRAWHAGESRWRGRDRCNDDSVGIELEGADGDCFTPAQYEGLAAVCSALAQRYPIAHVAGHQHIAPARKWDPGAGFDWRLLRAELGWPDRYFPEVVLNRPFGRAGQMPRPDERRPGGQLMD